MDYDGLSDEEKKEISPHVHAQVPPKKKYEWLRYAQEHHHGNLSSLVKEAVDAYISEEWVPKDQQEQSTQNVELDGLGDLNSKIDAIQNQLDMMMTDEFESERPVEIDERAVTKEANRVLDVLPEVPSEEAMSQIHQGVEIEDEQLPKVTGTVYDVAAYLDMDEETVRKACLYLEHHPYEDVESIIDNGLRRWFKINPRIDDWDEEAYLEKELPDGVEFVDATEIENE